MHRTRKPERRPSEGRIELRRVPRRVALKGLGALALTGLGCSSTQRATPGNAPPDSQAAAGAGASPAAPAIGSGGSAEPASSSAPAMPPADSGGMSSGAPQSAATGGAHAPAPADAGKPAVHTPDASAMAAADAGAMHDPMGLDALQCIVTPALEEGPFFVDEKLKRSDLVMGETDSAIADAVPLQLVIGVFEVSGTTCKPMSGVQVDVWQANAVGVYSDEAPGLIQSVDTSGKQFLRGYQITDEQGVVRFATIYPGWYTSRTIHIHFKLRMLDANDSTREFTSQMFFDETMNEQVLAKPPYSNRADVRMVRNADDHIYNGTAMNGQLPPAGTTPPGKQIMPAVMASGSGFTATLKIGVQS
jgi:protocatechuate 3,4-dioxygenase beta subunit